MEYRRIVLCIVLCAVSILEAAEAVNLCSPGEQASITLTLNEGVPHWELAYGGCMILKPSPLGLVLNEPYEGGFSAVGTRRATGDTVWQPVWGRFSRVRDHYNELTWQLREQRGANRRLDIIVRAYDAGVALRYKLHGTGQVELKADNTGLSFTGDYTCWSANGEHPNIGPVKLSQYKGHQFPLTVRIDEDCYASVLEAAIFDHAFSQPKRTGPSAFQYSFPGNNQLVLPAQTSWRVVLLGRAPGDLLTGKVMINLNPPSRIKDASWVKPGLAMWDWRAWGGKGKGGFVYNLDMASWRRMIDFASKHGIKYLVLDANWYGHEFDGKSNPMTSRDYLVYQPNPSSPKMGTKPAPENWDDPIDVPALIKYGKERKVGVVLYINDVARNNFDFDQTLATYRQWGAAGIKYGFMRRRGQDKVLTTREIVRQCAENGLLCDFHDGPVPPSGDRRTWPNYVAREFCHAQADATRSFTPETFCTTVFVNMQTGPLDMCNGFMTLTELEKQRPKVFKPIHSTVVAEAARVLITFSGLAFLPDTPESYESKADLFEFIARLPMTWDDTRILNGEIGKHITTARRAGRTWYIASCANAAGAELPIHFDFLEEGSAYQATLYEDAKDTHYVTNKESYRIRRTSLKKGDRITVRLAPGGGHCMVVEPKQKEMEASRCDESLDHAG